jgi:hypothetical protein
MYSLTAAGEDITNESHNVLALESYEGDEDRMRLHFQYRRY